MSCARWGRDRGRGRAAEEEPAVREESSKREKERERRGQVRVLESFLRANTDLSTRRHSWKRNLIREKLNSFKCTSRPLFAPYLSSRPPPSRWSSSLSLSLAPPVGTFSFLFRLLPLSATHLYSVNPFHCENVVLQSALLPSSPAPSVFTSLACFHRFTFFYALLEDAPLPCRRSLLSLSLSLSLYRRKLALSLFFYYSRSSLARRTALFDESSRSTSGYLTSLINGRRKILGFSLFRGTRPSSEARKVKWNLLLFTFACEAGSEGSRCNDTKLRDHNSGCTIIPDVVSRVYRRCFCLFHFIALPGASVFAV